MSARAKLGHMEDSDVSFICFLFIYFKIIFHFKKGYLQALVQFKEALI